MHFIKSNTVRLYPVSLLHMHLSILLHVYLVNSVDSNRTDNFKLFSQTLQCNIVDVFTTINHYFHLHIIETSSHLIKNLTKNDFGHIMNLQFYYHLYTLVHTVCTKNVCYVNYVLRTTSLVIR